MVSVTQHFRTGEVAFGGKIHWVHSMEDGQPSSWTYCSSGPVNFLHAEGYNQPVDCKNCISQIGSRQRWVDWQEAQQAAREAVRAAEATQKRLNDMLERMMKQLRI